MWPDKLMPVFSLLMFLAREPSRDPHPRLRLVGYMLVLGKIFVTR
jgi:hypothetical protein